MPRTGTKTEAFASFGTALTDVRMFWSDFAPGGGFVPFLLLQDMVNGRDGWLTYARENDPEAEWRCRSVDGHSAASGSAALSGSRFTMRMSSALLRLSSMGLIASSAMSSRTRRSSLRQ